MVYDRKLCLIKNSIREPLLFTHRRKKKKTLCNYDGRNNFFYLYKNDVSLFKKKCCIKNTCVFLNSYNNKKKGHVMVRKDNIQCSCYI